MIKKIKIAVLSGGTGRIGGLFLDELIKLDYKVYLLSRSKKKFDNIKNNKKFNNQITRLNFDLLNEKIIESCIKKVIKENKRIDCIVNCASFSNRGKNFKYNLKNLNKEMMGVFSSSFYLTEKLLPLLRKSSSGKIINVGSLWGMNGVNFGTYLDLDIGPSAITSSGKAALMQYTKYLSSRESENDITVNNLVPGWFPRKGKVERKDYIKSINSHIPLNRIGKLDDLKSAISFLLSDKNKYFTGQNVVVDGGFSII